MSRAAEFEAEEGREALMQQLAHLQPTPAEIEEIMAGRRTCIYERLERESGTHRPFAGLDSVCFDNPELALQFSRSFELARIEDAVKRTQEMN